MRLALMICSLQGSAPNKVGTAALATMLRRHGHMCSRMFYKVYG
ncbi:MAG: hypothetical protein QF824_05760 [Candidatus Woesearchaeota archaeon]|nr:hypothetical protein [Candidatus Woesearchaeota archaeon]